MFNNKKVIGVTGPSVYSPEVQSMVEEYFEAIPLSITQNGAEDLALPLSQIDGLIMAGGRDVCPLFYKQEITNGDSLSNFDLSRDKREEILIAECLKREIPVFGICRGHQMLGVVHGLFLIKDINGSEICHSPNYAKIDLEGLPAHFVECFDEFSGEFFEKEFVNSFHHQALWYTDKQKGKDWIRNKGIEVLGIARTQYKTSNKDEQQIIELMRGENKKWISCQWHPELDYDSNAASGRIAAEFKKMIA